MFVVFQDSETDGGVFGAKAIESRDSGVILAETTQGDPTG